MDAVVLAGRAFQVKKAHLTDLCPSILCTVKSFNSRLGGAASQPNLTGLDFFRRLQESGWATCSSKLHAQKPTYTGCCVEPNRVYRILIKQLNDDVKTFSFMNG